MSGIEVAGIVLSSLQILISAAEFYKKGFAPLKKWKRFRTEFVSFINAVDTQKLLFEKVLERFLMTAGIPDEELDLFLTKPNYEGWYGKEATITIRERYGNSYAVYISTIQEMQELMGDIQTLLSLKDGKVCPENSPWGELH